MPSLALHILASSWLSSIAVLGRTFDPLTYVDPLIGASNGGNVFPGASLPFGMAKAVADTNSGSNQGGFTLDGSPVTGFSMMHDSGTGGSPSLGNFPLFPYTSCAGGDVDGCAYPKKLRANFGSFDNSAVSAVPGHFGITLKNGIHAEMTAAMHTALFKFTFPGAGADGSPAQPLILQDLSDLSDSRQDKIELSEIRVVLGEFTVTLPSNMLDPFGVQWVKTVMRTKGTYSLEIVKFYPTALAITRFGSLLALWKSEGIGAPGFSEHFMGSFGEN